VAKALGAKQISLELAAASPFTQRLGDTAAKHGMVAAYHSHTQATIDAWDDVLKQSKGNAVNLDCGHYVAGSGQSPIPAIVKLADRIASLHLKDRTTPAHCELNLPWGTGDTPIVEILQTMKKNKYKFPASVELDPSGFRREGRFYSVRSSWRNSRHSAKPRVRKIPARIKHFSPIT
jgi:sugar phosphate isomerase/epimerase